MIKEIWLGVGVALALGFDALSYNAGRLAGKAESLAQHDARIRASGEPDSLAAYRDCQVKFAELPSTLEQLLLGTDEESECMKRVARKEADAARNAERLEVGISTARNAVAASSEPKLLNMEEALAAAEKDPALKEALDYMHSGARGHFEVPQLAKR